MGNFDFDNVTIYHSIYEYIDSNMYAIIEDRNALIIDPHDDIELFEKLRNVKNVTILLTHGHPDHISGVFKLQQQFNTTLICSKFCADYISKEKNIRPVLITFVLEERDRQNGTNFLDEFKKKFVPHTYLADITFENSYKMIWQKHSFEFFNILGHSKGSCVIIMDGNIVFTGDTLLKDYPIITRFPGGNKKLYIESSLPFLNKILKPDMFIMPGHGKSFQLKEIIKDGKINVEFR